MVRKRTHQWLFTQQEKLVRSEKALEQLNTNLEEQVKQRTEKLYESNEQLTRQMRTREQSEKALQESEKKYRDLFENISDFLFTHDLEGNFIETNLAIKSILEPNIKDIGSLSIKKILLEKHLPQFKAYLERINSAGHNEGYFQFLAKDGTTHVAEYKNQLVKKFQWTPGFCQGICP